MKKARHYQEYTDEQLMAQLQSGDGSVFNEIYRRYSQRLLVYFYRMFAGDRQKAQDFLQDTFLRLFSRQSLFNPELKFSTWLFTMAHNLAKNEFRRQQVRKIVATDHEIDWEYLPEPLTPFPDERIDQADFRRLLFKELEQMEPEKRDIFILRFQEHFSIKEIGAIMDCPEGTVKSRLFYIIQKLAQRLHAYDPNQIEVK